jgi:hypothetical protein
VAPGSLPRSPARQASYELSQLQFNW